MKIYYEEDRFIHEVLEHKEYSFLFKYPTVIDLGCNIGTFSLFIYDYADTIFAVDLAEDNIKTLQATITANELKKIKPFCEAIGGTTKPRKVIRNGLAGNGSWYLNDKELDAYVIPDITPITLCQFMDREKIEYADLVKMDVEGAEIEIVKGKDFPSHRIGTIVGENHYTGDPLMLINYMEKIGFRYHEDSDRHFIAKHL